MHIKKVFSSILLIISLVSLNFSSFIAIPVSAQEMPQTEFSEEISVYRVYYKSAEEIQKLMAFDLFEFNNLEEKYVLVAVDQTELKQIQQMGFKVELDQEETENYALLELLTQNQLQTIPGYSCYRTVEETYATAANLAATHPNLATWIDVGNSWEKSVGQSDGFDLFVLKLTNSVIPGDKPKLFITAAIHAREYTTAELATRFAEYLVNNYNVDPDVTWLLDYHEIHLMLQMNPDGRKEAESGYSWRKNTNENYCGITSTNRGADLNRNYSFYWNSCSGCSSGYPCDATYRGPSPASEPEVQAVQAYMRSIFPDQRDASLSSPAPADATGIFIDLHSYSQLVLWPWGMTSSLAPNNSGLQTLGRKFAFFNSYTPQRAYQLYGTDGDSTDFAYGDLGIAAYTFELGTAFFQACSTFEGTILPTNLQALLYAAKVVRTPYLTPAGPDTLNLAVSSTLVPVGTVVTLMGLANDTRYKSGTGEPTQAIATAEYYIDTPPWVNGAFAITMSPSDGSYNSTSENVTASVNTTGWSEGRHTLYLRSRDAAGNWGAVSAIFLSVEGVANQPPLVSDIPGQTILEGESFLSIALDAYVIDADNPDEDMLWSFTGNSGLSVSITDRIATIAAPDTDWNGSETITFRATDPGGLWDEDSATFSVIPVNDAPTADPQSVTVVEDTATSIILTGTDIDGDSLTYTVETGPSHGSLSETVPDLTYIPALNYNGPDSFTFKVNDGTVDSNIATVTITVTAVNDAPVADTQNVTTPEDTALSLVLTGSDQEGDPLSFSIQSGPAHGSLSGTGANQVYTPSENYNGEDSFTFIVNDGAVNSIPALVSITISPVNDAPIAQPQDLETTQDTPVIISLSGSDIDGDPLTYTVTSSPTHGLLSGTAPTLTYTPDPGFVGADSFEFTVSDSSAPSLPAAVVITVTNTNDAPIAVGQSLSTNEDTELAITLSASDADGDQLTYRVVSGPGYGTLTGIAPALIYMPEENYHGADFFTFVANDGSVDSEIATVSITVNPVNDAPIANPQTVVTSENTSVDIFLTGTDVEGSVLTFSIQTGPLHGTITDSGASVVYTPASGYEGEDSFTFIVNDGELNSAPATVSITVTRTNAPPIADPQTLTTNEDSALAITLTGSDSDSDPINFEVVGNPSHGELTGAAPNLTYTPNSDYHGSDSFSFVVNDGLVDSEEATITITVVPVNDAPTAAPQSVTVVEDTATSIILTGTDIDGDNLTFTVETGPSHGSLSGTAPDLTYTPAANYFGPDSFIFKVNDGTVDSNIATVTITVTAVNDAPVADTQNVTTPEDTALSLVLTGSDQEGDPLSFSIQSGPAHGSLSGTGANQVYTPTENYNGEDSFTFVVNDGEANSSPALVSIMITPVNDAPVAAPQLVTTDEDTAKSITLTGSDVDSVSLTFTVITQPTNGTLAGTAPNLIYTPATNYNSSDSFTFKVNDGEFDSSPATVSITVTPINDAPLAEAQSVVTNENTAVAIILVGSDVDGDPLTYLISENPSHGILSGNPPNLVYTPSNYYSGGDQFSFYVNDGLVNSNTASVTIQISDINYLPIVYNQSLSTNQDVSLSIMLTGIDPDGDVLSFFTKSSPQHGVLIGTAPNLVYTPDPGYTGSDSFTFAASDQKGESNDGVISIQVTPSGPLTVFFDDFETDLGWVRNANGTDTATLGYFERANPENVVYNGDKQLGTTVSGSFDLVTGPLAGSSAGSYDLDGGKTSMLSPIIELPTGRDLEMSFSYYVSHYTNSSTADYLRVYIIGENTVKIFEELGANNDDDAFWAAFSGDISNFAGQTIQILIEAADASTASYFEAAVDDILIIATTPNNPPVAEGQSYEMVEDASLEITLLGSDPNGDVITFIIDTPPSHGVLSGEAPDLTYTPSANYNGFDSFTFIVNDGKLDSEPATSSINITAVNDAPIALAQTISTSVDVPVEITLIGTDAEGDSLTYSLVTQPTHGTLNGTAPDLVYSPASGYTGTDTFQFKVNDNSVDSSPAVVNIEVNPAGPVTVFWDDFETNQGWVVNPNGVDTATLGTWLRANPETVSYYGYKQLGTTVSGSYDLVTGPLAGSSAGSYDLDGGLTSIRSPQITLPTGRDLTISFSYYLAHYSNSSTADYLRVKIVGTTTATIFQELGANNDDDAAWATFTGSLNDFAGQTVYILIEAADASTASLVEAAIDDILIIAE